MPGQAGSLDKPQRIDTLMGVSLTHSDAIGLDRVDGENAANGGSFHIECSGQSDQKALFGAERSKMSSSQSSSSSQPETGQYCPWAPSEFSDGDM